MNSNQINCTCDEQVTYERIKTIKDIQDELWETNVAKGWHKLKRTPLEMHALITTEIAEATEAVRLGIPAITISDYGKPEGEAVELADAMIRILNYFTEMGWDAAFLITLKNDYNKTREKLHGKRM